MNYRKQRVNLTVAGTVGPAGSSFGVGPNVHHHREYREYHCGFRRGGEPGNEQGLCGERGGQ